MHEDELVKLPVEELEKNEGNFAFDFICAPLPEEIRSHFETSEQRKARKNELVSQRIESSRRDGKSIDVFATNYITGLRKEFLLSLEKGEVPKRSIRKLFTLGKLRLLGFRDPKAFVDVCINQPSISFFLQDDKKEIAYKSVVSLAENLKKHFGDPVGLITRASSIGLSIANATDISSKNGGKIREQLNKLMGFPENDLKEAATFLQGLSWLHYSSDSESNFASELEVRVDFISRRNQLTQTEQSGLLAQQLLEKLCGSPIHNLTTVMTEPQIITDLLVVAEEFFVISYDFGKENQNDITSKLRFLAENPKVLRALATALKKGFSLEPNQIESILGSYSFNSHYFERLMNTVDTQNDQQRSVANVLELHSVETQEEVSDIEVLIRKMISQDFDKYVKTKIMNNLSGTLDTDASIHSYENATEILNEWTLIDRSLMGNSDFSKKVNQTKYARRRGLKKIIMRTLLLKDENTFDLEFLDYLLRETDVPVANYLDPETTQKLPKTERLLINLLLKDPYDSKDMWLFFMDNKDKLAQYVDADFYANETLVNDFLGSNVAYGFRGYERIAVFLKSTDVTNQFIEHLNLIQTLFQTQGLSLQAHYLPVISIFREESDIAQREQRLLEYWEEKYPPAFIATLNKQTFKQLFGEARSNSFLSALPKETNERRNAFLHNKYDRTSEWFILMYQDSRKRLFYGQDNVDALAFNFIDDIAIAEEFIRKFGLAKNVKLFMIFKALMMSEKDTTFIVPDSIANYGLKSVEDLFNQYTEIEKYLIDPENLTDISKLTKFQLLLLSSATGRDTHSFSRSDSMEDIVKRFEFDFSSGLIAPISPEYKTHTLSISDVEITYTPSEEVAKNFELLMEIINEIFVELSGGFYWKKIASEFLELLAKKKAELKETVLTADEGKKSFIEKQLAQIDTITGDLAKVQSIDELFKIVGAFNPDRQQKDSWSIMLQKIVLYRMLEVGGAQNKLQSLVASAELTPTALLTAINVYDEIIKHHVIKFDSPDNNVYWNDDVRDFFTDKRFKSQLKQMQDVFQNMVRIFKGDVSRFSKDQLSTTSAIEAVPDKGLIGEMSGYIANACYTNEISLLAKWPVTPYRFVDRTKTPAELIGTALVFELDLKNGEKALLVRAMNIPKEAEHNIDVLFETFLDKVADTAKSRGASKVLVPGLTGAMSNYQITTNHIKTTYCDGKDAISLSKEFKFNSYDLTDNCFVAREVT